jgi:arylsulfatase A-like enzyme
METDNATYEDPICSRITCSFFFFFLVSSFLLYPAIAQTQVTPKYNVLMICVHDMNDHVGFLGNTEPYTPNFNRLAAHGMVFRYNYCPYPLCSPSRTSLLSGWRPDKTKVFDNGTHPRSVMGSTIKFLPEYFSQYGYRTERYGHVMQSAFENEIKWDYAEPPQKAGPEISESGDISIDNSENSGGAWWIDNTPDSSRADGKEAIHLINRLRQAQTKPFFFALGFVQTHSPFTPNLYNWNKNGDHSKLEPLPDESGNLTFKGTGSGNIILPQTPANDLADIPSIALHQRVIKTNDDWRRTIHAYEGDLSFYYTNYQFCIKRINGNCRIFCGGIDRHLFGINWRWRFYSYNAGIGLFI